MTTTKDLTLVTFAVAVAVWAAPHPAAAYIAGDGKGGSATDCFVGLEGYTEDDQTPFGRRHRPTIQCADGAACDLDGEANGSCVFSIAVTVNKPGVPGCTPRPLRYVIAKAKTGDVVIDFADHFDPPLDGTVTTSPWVDFRIRWRPRETRLPKPGLGRVKLKARAPVDRDRFRFVCHPPPPVCHMEEAREPRLLAMGLSGLGSDLDVGMSGRFHDFSTPFGPMLQYGLRDCDAATTPVCRAEGPTGAGTVNGASFGPPLPIFAVGVPVCLVNEYAESTIRGTANVQTGAFVSAVDGVPTPLALRSGVFQCSPTEVCPRCTSGRCSGGARAGAACRVDATVIVNNPPAVVNELYNLSNDCPPGGSSCARLATVDVTLDLTTAASILASSTAGAFPCPGQRAHDECPGASTCTIDCSPDGPEPTSPPKGGVSQTCCSDPSRTPCFPTSPAAGSLPVVRIGQAIAPTPAWPDPAYPKTGAGTVAATGCFGSSASVAVDGSAGLPGPVAMTLPVDTTYWSDIGICL